jgi:DNA-binding Lrp family transcriptional regulator
MSLDETDRRILSLLRTDARMPYSRIADTLGLSRLTVKKHIEKMLNKDLVRMTAKINMKKQGVKMAMLGLEVKSGKDWDECLNKLEDLPWVLIGFRTIGKSNLKVLIVGGNDEELEKNIDDFRYYHCVNFIDVEILGKPVVGNV